MDYSVFGLNDVYSVVYDKKRIKTYLLSGNWTDAIATSIEAQVTAPIIERSNVTTFVLNMTEECNLRCRYCSRYRGDYSTAHMNHEDLEEIIRSVIRYADNLGEKCVIQFHGGEPLIRFPMISDVLGKFNKEELRSHLDLRIQTNGTLLTPAIIEFCNDYDVHIGLSIDGPASVTNHTRQFPNGTGISDVLEQKIHMLQSLAKRKYISCLCVVTKNSIGKADEIFDFILAHSIDDVSILPLYNDYSCISDDKSIIPKNAEMADFSCQIMDKWLDSLAKGKTVCIPNFQIWVWNLLTNNANHYFDCHSCCGVGETMLFIDKNGDVFPCGPFSYYPEMRIGNLFDTDMNLSSLREKSKVVSSIIDRNPPECSECGLQGICKRGCVANSYLNYKNVVARDPYCEYWKRIISHLLLKLIDNPELISLIPDYTIRL